MKTIFITGAGRGIGLATARHFASQGWFVGLFDIDEEGLKAAIATQDFPQACIGYCDVTDRMSIDEALAHFSSQTDGRLDVLVNNAGTLAQGKFEEIDPAAHDMMIDVNIRGLTQVAQAAFGLLQQTPGSTLVNLCSVSSIHGFPFLAVYSASKFYVNGLTEALNLEWAEHGIRVTCVKPSVVNTAMGDQVNQGFGRGRDGNIAAEDVALAIATAVQGKKTGYVLGGVSRLWFWLDRLLPQGGRQAIARRFAGM